MNGYSSVVVERSLCNREVLWLITIWLTDWIIGLLCHIGNISNNKTNSKNYIRIDCYFILLVSNNNSKVLGLYRVELLQWIIEGVETIEDSYFLVSIGAENMWGLTCQIVWKCRSLIVPKRLIIQQIWMDLCWFHHYQNFNFSVGISKISILCNHISQRLIIFC